MKTNEETNFVTGSVQTKLEKKADNQSVGGWQSVTIGGVSGIMMGAGAMYAVDALGKRSTQEEETAASGNDATGGNVANTEVQLGVAEVDQSLTFGEAFAAARDAVGAGGVFHWHGNIYNTYTKNEWENMSAEEKAQFARLIQPEIKPGEGHTAPENTQSSHKPTVDTGHKPEKTTEQQENLNHRDEETTTVQTVEAQDDGEVHFLGFSNIEIDGQQHIAGHAARSGRHVYYLDMDEDPEFKIDHVASDENNDGRISTEEVHPFKTEATMGEFALLSILEEENTVSGDTQTTMNEQDNIAPNMPDYVNDANI